MAEKNSPESTTSEAAEKLIATLRKVLTTLDEQQLWQAAIAVNQALVALGDPGFDIGGGRAAAAK